MIKWIVRKILEVLDERGSEIKIYQDINAQLGQELKEARSKLDDAHAQYWRLHEAAKQAEKPANNSWLYADGRLPKKFEHGDPIPTTMPDGTGMVRLKKRTLTPVKYPCRIDYVDGHTEEVYNLASYAKAHKLHSADVYKILRGQKKTPFKNIKSIKELG